MGFTSPIFKILPSIFSHAIYRVLCLLSISLGRCADSAIHSVLHFRLERGCVRFRDKYIMNFCQMIQDKTLNVNL
jgi:hypothetical protein